MLHKSRSALIGEVCSLAATLFSFLAAGCALQSPPPPAQRVMMRGFSFVPGEQWESITRFETRKAEFASRIGDNRVWAKAVSFEVRTDPGGDPDKALDPAYSIVVREQLYGLGNDAQVVWSKSHNEEVAGARCSRKQTLLKSKATNNLVTCLLCSHPESSRQIVALEHAQKWPEQSYQIDDEAQREVFLNSLQFGPLPLSSENDKRGDL